MKDDVVFWGENGLWNISEYTTLSKDGGGAWGRILEKFSSSW